MSTQPILWHIQISHYSEKVRWALAHKRIEHRRRAPLPGTHIPIALWLTRGRQFTFPVIELDGRQIGDSTAIIAALEERYPDRPLYPAGAAERDRALALEDFFDEELGPSLRLLVFHELGKDPKLFGEVGASVLPGPFGRFESVVSLYGRTLTAVRYRVRSERSAARARERVLAALDRLEQELGDGDYLVGDSFSVADLTAAALFYPLVNPPEGPLAGVRPPAGLQAFRAPLEGRRGYRWVEQMYRLHREPSREGAAQAV
jgi:glutathione S-transferase